jgi:hypothetical protein
MTEDEARTSLPTRTDFFGPLLHELMAAGGSAPVRDLLPEVCESMGLTREQQTISKRGREGHQAPCSSGTEVYNRATWALTELQHIGDVVRSNDHAWKITYQGRMKTMRW